MAAASDFAALAVASLMVIHLAHFNDKQSSYCIVPAIVRVLQIVKIPVIRILLAVILIVTVCTMDPMPQKRRMEIHKMDVGVAAACLGNDVVEECQHSQP